MLYARSVNWCLFFGVCSLLNVCLMVLKLLEWSVWLSDFYFFVCTSCYMLEVWIGCCIYPQKKKKVWIGCGVWIGNDCERLWLYMPDLSNWNFDLVVPELDNAAVKGPVVLTLTQIRTKFQHSRKKKRKLRKNFILKFSAIVGVRSLLLSCLFL